MAFECVSLNLLRSEISDLIGDFEEEQVETDLVLKMKNFLGQDGSLPHILVKRGMYLSKLRTKWLKIADLFKLFDSQQRSEENKNKAK